MTTIDPRHDSTQTTDIVHHWTVQRIGRRAFHLEMIDMGKETAQLHVIIAVDNAPEKIIIDYEFPPDFKEVLVAMAEACPMHMVGFEGEYLANAASIWGYVCPCGL